MTTDFDLCGLYGKCLWGESREYILKKLTGTKQAEQKAIVFLLQAIWEMEKVPEDYINHKALKFAEKTETKDNIKGDGRMAAGKAV